MPFLYPHHPRDRPAASREDSWDDYTQHRPRLPERALTTDSGGSSDTRPRREPRTDRHRGRKRAEGDRETKKPRTESQERRRAQRREDRRAQDPEYETRRQERRLARRAERAAARETSAQNEGDVLQHDQGAAYLDVVQAIIQPNETEQVHNSQEVRSAAAESDRTRRYRSTPRPREPRTESWTSTERGWTVDLERARDNEKYQYDSRPGSMFNELDWYKRVNMPDHAAMRQDHRRCRCCFGKSWSRKRKIAIFGLLALSIIAFIAIIAGAVTATRNSYSFTPSVVQVNNTIAFQSGGATHNSVNDTKDGIGAGVDAYNYYQGNATNFPSTSRWVSFEDMWTANMATLQQSCGWLQEGLSDNTEQEIADIRTAVQDRANASLVDHRLILALILQESYGCVRVQGTVSSGGVRNPGLMQSHNGHAYDARHGATSILAMVQDGTQGTLDKFEGGDGLVQLLNIYGDPYMAARAYNSGYIPSSGNLSEAAGATACYASDVANRLTGWVSAKSTCP